MLLPKPHITMLAHVDEACATKRQRPYNANAPQEDLYSRITLLFPAKLNYEQCVVSNNVGTVMSIETRRQ